MTDHKDNRIKECFSSQVVPGFSKTLTREELRSSEGALAACVDVHMHVLESRNRGSDCGEWSTGQSLIGDVVVEVAAALLGGG
jgi:hypothetical protein